MRRVLLDQGLPVTTAHLLRAEGWVAIHVREIDMAAAEDSEILNHAEADRRVVVTLDRDFPQILAITGRSLPSVILIRQERKRGVAVAELLKEIWSSYEEHLDRGCVLSVAAHATTIRPLPLT